MIGDNLRARAIEMVEKLHAEASTNPESFKTKYADYLWILNILLEIVQFFVPGSIKILIESIQQLIN